MIYIITLIGAVLRFYDLGSEPLWTDEAWFGFLAYSEITQEFIPAYFVKILGLKTEFGLRFLSALCGTLTIPAVYLVVKRYKNFAAFLIAVCPIFIFWSRMARPYSVSGLLMVLGWRWWYMMIPAMLTTPISLIGIISHKWKIILPFIVLGIAIYFLREDSGRAWTFEQVLNSSRWFYLPALVSILLFFDRLMPYLDGLSGRGDVLGLAGNFSGLLNKRNRNTVVLPKTNKVFSSGRNRRIRKKNK